MQTVKNEAGTLLPQAFTFNASNQQVRTVMIAGEPYFVAKDICTILDISNHIDALSRLDDDEKGRSVLPTQFGAKETNLVNESGLYHLIFQSRKPEAKAFRKWVTAEVLPALSIQSSKIYLLFQNLFLPLLSTSTYQVLGKQSRTDF